MQLILVAVFIIVGLVLYEWWIMHTTEDGAPFVPLSPETAMKVISAANITKQDTFYDLGSGDGRLVIAAATRGANAYGIEKDKFRVLYSRFWIKVFRLNNAKIIMRDIFNTNISKATVVCTYLLQETNDKLQQKIINELKSGTKVISVNFTHDKLKLLSSSPVHTPHGPIYVYEVRS